MGPKSKLRGASMLVLGVSLGLGVAFGARWIEGPVRSSSAFGFDGPSDSTVRLVADTIARVRREYVDGIEEERLLEGAISGILTKLDEHSSYLDEGAYEDIRIATTGNYSGVGIDVDLSGGKVTVIEPIAGAPAEVAGIRACDIVVAVDGVAVDPADVSATVDRMRGAPGTTVTLDVRRGDAEPQRYALTRADVKVRTIMSEYQGNGLAWVRLTQFADSTPYDLAVATRDLTRQAEGHLRGIVLDLRNNPGGVLDSAVGVADAFLGEGLIVSGVGRGPHSAFEQYARKGDSLESVAVVVLVNRNSASASEIVAGALQDHHRAKVVGEKTFGKGSVQTVMPVGHGAIKLTTSRYLTPSGRAINNQGIEPDVLVPSSGYYRGRACVADLKDDPQLTAALNLLHFGSLSFSHAR